MVIFGMSVVLARITSKSGTLIGWLQRTRLLIIATGCAARWPGVPALASSPPTRPMPMAPRCR